MFLRMMMGDYLVGTQIWLMLPLMVMAVPFVLGWSSASTLLASRLMAANTSIAIVHQIDFMDSSRITEGIARELPDSSMVVSDCFCMG